MQQERTVTRSVKVWSADAIDNLKGSLDCTDSDMFVNSAAGTDELTETVCECVNFCSECSIPQRDLKMFPNN